MEKSITDLILFWDQLDCICVVYACAEKKEETESEMIITKLLTKTKEGKKITMR